MDDNADDYAAMQMTFVINVADYKADADNIDNFTHKDDDTDDGRQQRRRTKTHMMDSDADNGIQRRQSMTAHRADKTADEDNNAENDDATQMTMHLTSTQLTMRQPGQRHRLRTMMQMTEYNAEDQ